MEEGVLSGRSLSMYHYKLISRSASFSSEDKRRRATYREQVYVGGFRMGRECPARYRRFIGEQGEIFHSLSSHSYMHSVL